MKEIENLWKRALNETWNPEHIDIEADKSDWNNLNQDQRKYLADLFFHQLMGEYEVLIGVSRLATIIKEKDARFFLLTHARDNTVHANIFERVLIIAGEDTAIDFKTRVSESYYELVYSKPRKLLNDLEKKMNEKKLASFLTMYYLATDGILYNTSFIALEQMLFSAGKFKNLYEAYKKINVDEKRQTIFAAYYIKYLSEKNEEIKEVVKETLNECTTSVLSTIGYFSSLAQSFGRNIEDFASLSQGVIEEELKIIGIK